MTPIEHMAGVQHRADGAFPPEELVGMDRQTLSAVLLQRQEDIEFLLKTVEQRTTALREAVEVVQQIADTRGMEECMAADCTMEHPRCGIRIARAALAGRLGRWKG